MPQISPVEKRSNQRHRYIAEISYGSEFEIGRGLAHNISLGGVLVSADSRLPVGTDLLITVPFAKKSRYISLRGTVERISNNGFAVSFRRRKHRFAPFMSGVGNSAI